MNPVVIVHHHEITLKGQNRPYFERQLLRNVRLVLRGIVPSSSISGGYGRFVIDLASEQQYDEVSNRLTTVFGLSNICAGVRVGQDVDEFCASAEKLLEAQKFKTIRVDARRVDKNFAVGSMEVNARVGEFLCTRFGVRANLTAPDETVYIEIVNGAAYVYRSKMQGIGGLPVGVSGRVVGLLSAGFDSPVACWKLMKRGASVIFIHFHSMPYTSQQSVDQVRALVKILTRYQFSSKLYIIPFADVQNEIVLHAPQSLRVIMYRRTMIRIADAVARQEKAEALVTGESVGQVASQTLRNIRVIDEATTLTILRPLSGTDKEETMVIARRIGSYEISKEPYDDCCSFLAPRKPETWANLFEAANAEMKLDIPGLIAMALEKKSVERFALPEFQHTAPAEAVPD